MIKGKQIQKKFFAIFLVVPDSMFSFVSGIFLSVAINIATSQIPDSIWTNLPKTIIGAMFLFFSSCICFILLAISVRPYQENHSHICEQKKFENRSEDWLNYLKGKKVKVKWSILFLIAVITAMSGIFLIII